MRSPCSSRDRGISKRPPVLPPRLGLLIVRRVSRFRKQAESFRVVAPHHSLAQARSADVSIQPNPMSAKTRAIRKAGSQEGLASSFSWIPGFLRWPFPHSAESLPSDKAASYQSPADRGASDHSPLTTHPMPSPGIEPGLRPSRGRVRIRHTPRTKHACRQSPTRESNPALRLRRPPCAQHTRRESHNSLIGQYPRQELNLVFDLRRVACGSVTLQGLIQNWRGGFTQLAYAVHTGHKSPNARARTEMPQESDARVAQKVRDQARLGQKDQGASRVG
jgi:hypothetical protein